jgi:hypothetical protein
MVLRWYGTVILDANWEGNVNRLRWHDSRTVLTYTHTHAYTRIRAHTSYKLQKPHSESNNAIEAQETSRKREAHKNKKKDDKA